MIKRILQSPNTSNAEQQLVASKQIDTLLKIFRRLDTFNNQQFQAFLNKFSQQIRSNFVSVIQNGQALNFFPTPDTLISIKNHAIAAVLPVIFNDLQSIKHERAPSLPQLEDPIPSDEILNFDTDEKNAINVFNVSSIVIACVMFAAALRHPAIMEFVLQALKILITLSMTILVTEAAIQKFGLFRQQENERYDPENEEDMMRFLCRRN